MSQGTGDVICSSFPLHYNVTIIFLQMTCCFLRIHEFRRPSCGSRTNQSQYLKKFGKHQIRDNIDIRNLVQDSQKKKTKQYKTKKKKAKDTSW